MVIIAPTVLLSDRKRMPVVGLGTYARKADSGQYRQAVEDGIDVGYRHIDTASSYHNEEEVGDGIANKIKQGVVKREELFVTTKLWNHSHAGTAVIPALKESLARLKLNYVDMYLIHWPVSVDQKNQEADIDFVETWHAMEEALHLGLTRSIGVSNFNQEQLQRLIEQGNVKPTVNQFEINPTLTQDSLVHFCKQNGIVPVAYTPLGLLSDARQEFKDLDAIKLDPKLTAIAEKYNRSKAQIVLRYLIQRDIVVIPKSFTKSRMIENISLFDFELSKDEMSVVGSFNIDHRCVPALPFQHLKNYPFTV